MFNWKKKSASNLLNIIYSCNFSFSFNVLIKSGNNATKPWLEISLSPVCDIPQDIVSKSVLGDSLFSVSMASANLATFLNGLPFGIMFGLDTWTVSLSLIYCYCSTFSWCWCSKWCMIMEKVKVQFLRTIDTHISHVNPAKEKRTLCMTMSPFKYY